MEGGNGGHEEYIEDLTNDDYEVALKLHLEELVAFATKQTFGLFNRVLNQLALCTLISSGPLSGCDMF